MAKKISWLEAAEIIGVCDRTMRRVPMEPAERVLAAVSGNVLRLECAALSRDLDRGFSV